MKLLFIGDFTSDFGPGMANKNLRAGFKNNQNIFFYDTYGINKKLRLKKILSFKILSQIKRSDAVVFCSGTRLNSLLIHHAKFFRKPIFYILHGLGTYESELNGISISKKVLRHEKHLFRKVNRFFCVSKAFCDFMKQREQKYQDKFDFNYNALDVEKIQTITTAISDKTNIVRENNLIFSLGGGRRQKNNLRVCEAIQHLNQVEKMDLKYIVIGAVGKDTDEICKFNFVEYHNSLPNDQVLKIMQQSTLYIQNSIFESFGLAPFEALLAGSNLLVSKNVGALGLLGDLIDEDIIINQQDINEIAAKIKYNLANHNAERLYESIDIEMIKPDNVAINLMTKIQAYLEKSEVFINEN